MNLPSVDTVNAHRIAKFKERVTGALATAELGVYRSIVEQVEAETGTTLIDIAAALATLAQGPTPLLLGTSVKPAGRAEPAATPATRTEPPGAKAPAAKVPGAAAPPATAVRPLAQLVQPVPPAPPARPQARPRAAEMETFRLEVGSIHGIKPGNIVGAIANESGIEGVHIGRVDIREDHSYVDLPEGMPKPIFTGLQKVRVAGRELRITRVSVKPPKPPRNPAGRHAERKLLTRR